MTTKTIIYHKAKGTAIRGASSSASMFSNHPNLLTRDTYYSAKLQKFFDIQRLTYVKSSQKQQIWMEDTSNVLPHSTIDVSILLNFKKIWRIQISC